MPKEKNFIEFIKEFDKTSIGQSLSKTPYKFLEKYGYLEYSFLIVPSYKETRENIYRYVYGEQICICGKIVTKFWSWNKGWSKTCSEECENKHHSSRQLGEKNTSHRMTVETKNAMRQKMSNIMKNKIMNGEFTPKSENYKTFGMIHFRQGNDIRKVRSMWELIYWLQNEKLEYEKIRIEYFDTVTNRKRVYITDFYDSEKNKIIEIKPKKYQDQRFIDKRKSVLQSGYDFEVIDEEYFKKIKNDDLINRVKYAIIDYEKYETRLKWLKKV